MSTTKKFYNKIVYKKLQLSTNLFSEKYPEVKPFVKFTKQVSVIEKFEVDLDEIYRKLSIQKEKMNCQNLDYHFTIGLRNL